MNKIKFSIAAKLNILIIAIILTVSIVLINISGYTFKKITYTQIIDVLEKIEDKVDDGNEALLPELSLCYAVTQLEGYEEVRSEAEASGDYKMLIDWCGKYKIQYSTGEAVTNEEFNARMDALVQEAKDQGLKDDDEIMEWVEEKEPEIGGYADADLLFESVKYSLYSIANQTGISNIRVYVKDNDGYMKLTEGDSAAEGNTFFQNVLTFGKHYDSVALFDDYTVYKGKSGREYVQANTDKGPVLAKIIPVEYDGIEYIFVYDYNISSIDDGQRKFIIYNLILIIIMIIIAVVISLIIMGKIVIKPLKLLADGVKSFHLSQKDSEKAEIIDLPINSHDEIGVLYKNIQSMETQIIEDSESITKMTAEKERISVELDLANKIQADTLPQEFPPFPDRTEFDIYASMDPAKAVGGDFYDFFLVDDDHLALVIADVSGKGIPAALFMMISKVLIQNISMDELSPAKVLENTNRQISSNNYAEMFVTTWLGILELSTGKLVAANAGHEFPAIKYPGGAFELYKDKHGFVMGGMEGVKYKEYELHFEPGTKLFVYTDGVPEATNANEELFGNERMLEALNQIADGTPEEILHHVREEVDAFVGEADQFDDLTMLCIEYHG